MNSTTNRRKSEADASDVDLDVDMELSELLALADGSDAWTDWLAQSSGVEPLKIEPESLLPSRSDSPCAVDDDLQTYSTTITTITTTTASDQDAPPDKRLDRRRQQNRESMARLRMQKRESIESLTAQRGALQRILLQMLAHNKPVCVSGEALTPQQLFKIKMTELVRTREELLIEKQQLTDQILDRRQRELVVQRLMELTEATSHRALDREAHEKGYSTDESECKSEVPSNQDFEASVSTLDEEDPSLGPRRTTGYWLQFLDHEPPLFYEPLSHEACGSIVCRSLLALEQIRQALRTPEAAMLSTQCLGWKLERTREASPVNGKPLLRMRCVKRIPRSRATIQELQDRTWDFLCTPESITRVNHGSVTVVVAQQIGEDSLVLLRNSPDKSHHKLFRYFSLNTRLKTVDSALVLMIITDKEATPRETRRDGLSIKWIKHGCSCLRFTLVDGESVEIEYTGSIECISEEHATNLIIANCSALFKWEHLVVPPQLLAL